MPDWLVQRYIPNVPNEQTGAWVDQGVATDLKATEAQQAVDKLATTTGRHRAIRWDNTEEFDTTPGPATSTKATKQPRNRQGVGGTP